MNKNLTCNQVSALINFYIENKLNPRLRNYVDEHLAKCPHCKEKINKLRKILLQFRQSNENFVQKPQNSEIKHDILKKLSAYVDNELNSEENIKIKKMTISNPQARMELENLYKFQKTMHYAYERTKNDAKYDYSKAVMTQMQDGYEYSTTYFYKLATVFVVLLLSIIAGFIYLYF